MDPLIKWWTCRTAFLMVVVACCPRLQAQPKIEWDSSDILESRLTPHKLRLIGPPYQKPKDPKAPDPGRNCMIELTVLDAPPRLLDRLLKRNARISGRIADPPEQARSGKVWIEDNYGRVIDQAGVREPDFAFKLDASRSLSTGLYLKAELKVADKVVWSGTRGVCMVPPEADPWRDYLLGVYHADAKPGTGELLREMGLSHQAVERSRSPAFPVQQDLHFAPADLLYCLLGFYGRDLNRWRKIMAAQQQALAQPILQRHRCLNSDKERKFIKDFLTAVAAMHAPYKPLYYDIGERIGIGNMGAPHDLCGSKWCLARFRTWLQERYGTLEKLNARWDRKYKSWDEVEMSSNWHAVRATEGGNFSAWADRVEFMDDVLVDAVALGVRTVRAVDPGARCAITGAQPAGCWGYDLWKLTRVADVMAPRDVGEAPDVILSFYDDGEEGKLVGPGFGPGGSDLWRAFIRGCDAVQQRGEPEEAYSSLIDIKTKRPKPLGRQVEEFADWVHSGPGRLRNRARRMRDPVAILYSQPSLRGNWILEITGRSDVPQTGREWALRDAWSGRQKDLSYRVRLSWVTWMHDVGIWPKFVDASQVDRGYLLDHGYKVLVLPRAVALSDKTAGAIRKFVHAGGTVIADSWAGIMDETCRLRPKGALDDLFGVTRGDPRKINAAHLPPSGKGVQLRGGRGGVPFLAFEKKLKAVQGRSNLFVGGSADEADVEIVRRWGGNARTYYLNFNLEEYFLQRFFPRLVAPARKYLLALLAGADVKPLFTVGLPGGDAPFHPVGHNVAVYRSGRGYLVGVMINPTVRSDELAGIESRYRNVKDNIFLKKMHLATLKLPAALHAYDLIAQRALGEVRTVKMTSAPTRANVYACWPFAIRGVTATAEVTPQRHLRMTGKLLTSAPVQDEKLVVSLRVFRPDGSEQRAYRRTIDCDRDSFRVELPLGLNEHGNWSVVVRDPCSGKLAQQTVRLP